MHVFLSILFILPQLLRIASTAPPPANPALFAQPVPLIRNAPLHIQNITHNTCCITPGLTFDPCTTEVPCAYGRYCVFADSLHACVPGAVCICYPAQIILCEDPAHCPLGETCAFRPQDHHPFCVSQDVVDVDPSYLIFRGGCFPCSTRPPPTSPNPPPPATPSVSSKGSPTPNPSTRPPTTDTPTRTPPTPSSTSPPTAQPPTTKPPTTTQPHTAVRPSRRPTPSPLKSRPPSPRPSPAAPPKRPSQQPVITAVSPHPRPSTSTPSRPTPKPRGGLAGDSCSDTKECLTYRKCGRRDTLKDCDGHSDCICLGSRVCVCNDQCTDGEVCAGAPGRSYCFSPRLIDSLSWSTTLPCVGPAISPEVGGNTRPPTTTTPTVKIPGLTGEKCNTDANCRSPRKCVVGGGDSCIAGQALCDNERNPCQRGDETCYCYVLNTCNCSNDCRDTEVCIATTQGRICVSRTLLDQDGSVQEIRCGNQEEDDGGPILIVNVAQPEPPAALTDTPRPTPSPVRVPDASPGTSGQDAEGGEGVCIGIRALENLHSHQLVFENHRLAHVLCDASDSCATPGHIVVFHGKAMMMKTYCNTVGCINRIMHVNSPRLQRRLRVKSMSKALEFTAFAAKYETTTEEMVFSIAVRMGL